MKIDYHQEGDFLLPNITPGWEPKACNEYGMMRKRWMRKNMRGIFAALTMTGEADDYFYTFGEQCQKRVDLIKAQLLEKNPAPDKQTMPQEWARHMNTILNQAEEIVKTEMIYNKDESFRF
ncbi:MAG: TnpV protein [Lachnospiraceae bacterium]|nr:TnpV protein [Lachnospiraceae bacterium]